MTIIEAIKSGKRFKRPDGQWHERRSYSYSTAEVLADDWFLEEEKIEITRLQFEEAFNKASFAVPHVGSGFSNYICRIDVLAQELGFKS